MIDERERERERTITQANSVVRSEKQTNSGHQLGPGPHTTVGTWAPK